MLNDKTSITIGLSVVDFVDLELVSRIRKDVETVLSSGCFDMSDASNTTARVTRAITVAVLQEAADRLKARCCQGYEQECQDMADLARKQLR
ncbi:hypothetical protein H10PHJ05_28 [Aeromonas phage HJ05]|nr:hypothetical protein H10PHJ05_28 [Aeromonas phage HJ05]